MNPNRPVAEKILKNSDKVNAEDFIDQTYALTGDPRLISQKVVLSEKYRVAFQLLIHILATGSATAISLPKTEVEEKETALVRIPTEEIEPTGKEIIPNYYEVLGVNETANHQEIRKAYRQLAKQYHPDALIGQNLSKEEIDIAKRQMQDVNDAWFVLSKQSRRSVYDDIRYNPPVAQAPPPPRSDKTPKETGVAGGLAKEAVSRGFKVGAKQVGKLAANKLGFTAVSQAIGSAIPILGNLSAAAIQIAKEVGSFILRGIKKALSKIGDVIFGKRDKRESVFITGALLFLGGLVLPSTALLLAGLALGVGVGISILGGVAIGTGIAAYITAFFLAITAPARAIATTLIVAIVVIPLVVAFIVFIINSGAYVVPPGPPTVSGLVENPYIEVEKVARRAGTSDEPQPFLEFENSNLPVTIEYTITVTAKRATLTNINFDWSCTVVRDPDQTCPSYSSVTVNGESAPNVLPPAPPALISPANPYVITYTQLFRSGLFNDSLVIDTFTVSASVESEGVTQTQADSSATIKIGEPPIVCPLATYNTMGKRWASYTPGDETEGHGSNAYWSGKNACSYSLPQSIGCYGPTSPAASGNVCFNRSPKCAQYGYAYDVWPGSTDVLAPRLGGSPQTWNCNYAFSNGGGSAGHTFRCTSGQYMLSLTHIKGLLASGSTSGTFASGEKIGELFPMVNSHLHMEFSINGVYQRPEDFFCF